MQKERRHPPLLRFVLLGLMPLGMISFFVLLDGWLENPQGYVPLVRIIAQTATLMLVLCSMLVRPERARLSRWLLIGGWIALVVFIVSVFV